MNIVELVQAFDALKWKKLGHWKKSFMLDWIEATSLCLDRFQSVGLDWHIDNYGFVAHAALMSETDFVLTKQLYESELTRHQGFAQDHAQRCYKAGEALIEFSKELYNKGNWSEVSDADLSHLFDSFVSLVSKNIPFFPPLVALEQALDERLRLLLADHMDRVGISTIRLFDYLSILSVPKRLPDMLAKREVLLGIGQQIQSDEAARELFATTPPSSLITSLPQKQPLIWSALRSYGRDYGWLATFGWLGTPSTEINAIDELRDILSSHCAEQLISLQSDRKNSELAVESALQELKASDSLKHFVEIIREYAYLRAFRIDVYNKAYFYATALFREVAGRLRVTQEQLLFLTPPEVIQCLQGGLPASMDVIRDRERGFAILTLAGTSFILAGNDFESFESSREKEEYVQLNDVKGDPVVKGTVEGPVKIVMDASDLPKVNRGDVLVAPMTNPDFTAVFDKIAGIITDEGGVLCHAAIIAREYKLPCIISTKIATKVFRDDDFVLLNATDGTAIKLARPSTLSLDASTPRASQRFTLTVSDYEAKSSEEEALISWLGNTTGHSVSDVGSKFRNLSILHKRGVRIPPAFCLCTNAFARFIHHNDLKRQLDGALRNLDFEEAELVRQASLTIRTLIHDGEVPASIYRAIDDAMRELRTAQLSVRSSSSSEDLQFASFAGVYESYLNVQGIHQVLGKIKDCWSSLFSERSLFYYYRQLREGQLTSPEIGIAVIVQELVNSKKSGISFTCNPESGNDSEIVIQAAYGLGEGAVSGGVPSDIYIVQKNTYTVLKSTVAPNYTAIVPAQNGGVKEVLVVNPGSTILGGRELGEVARISAEIESIFGNPQDIEWCTDEGDALFILQSRPVTTMPASGQ